MLYAPINPLLLQVPVVRTLENVGSNLQDHLTTMLGPFFVNRPIVFDIVKFFTPSVVWQYLTTGTGKVNDFVFYILTAQDK